MQSRQIVGKKVKKQKTWTSWELSNIGKCHLCLESKLNVFEESQYYLVLAQTPFFVFYPGNYDLSLKKHTHGEPTFENSYGDKYHLDII